MNAPLPIEWFTIRTNLTQEKVYDRVASITGDYEWFRLSFRDTEILEGSVNRAGFVVREIERSPRRWRTPPPWVWGRTNNADEETRVDIFMYPGFSEIVGFIGFAAFVIIMLVNMAWRTMDTIGPWRNGQICAISIFSGLFLWLLIAFRLKVRKAKWYFQVLLKDKTPPDL